MNVFQRDTIAKQEHLLLFCKPTKSPVGYGILGFLCIGLSIHDL